MTTRRHWLVAGPPRLRSSSRSSTAGSGTGPRSGTSTTGSGHSPSGNRLERRLAADPEPEGLEDTDQRFRQMTAEVGRDWIIDVVAEPSGGWWWERLPVRGPVMEDWTRDGVAGQHAWRVRDRLPPRCPRRLPASELNDEAASRSLLVQPGAVARTARSAARRHRLEPVREVLTRPDARS